jgi:hypothetical protein
MPDWRHGSGPVSISQHFRRPDRYRRSIAIVLIQSLVILSRLVVVIPAKAAKLLFA